MFLKVNVIKLKTKRMDAGLSMKALSKKANLPENAILRIEKGENAKTNHLRANEIASALGCKVEDIFTPINKGV